MNERIEKLALQAGMHRDKFGMYFAGDKHDEDGVDLEKFAELIVKECAGLCVSNIADEICGGKGFSDKIKQHFGVEE